MQDYHFLNARNSKPAFSARLDFTAFMSACFSSAKNIIWKIFLTRLELEYFNTKDMDETSCGPLGYMETQSSQNFRLKK